MKTLFTTLLTFTLIGSVCAEEPFKLLSLQNADGSDKGPSYVAECMVGIGVLAAGYVVIVWLKHFCEVHLGTNSTLATNLPVQRIDNLSAPSSDNLKSSSSSGSAWATVGQAVWNGNYYEYRETNSINESAHFYRLVLQP